MNKNVEVVDEDGNGYGTTYVRRAKGLVKNGRARFAGANRICLARPPNQPSEDKTMSDIYTQAADGGEAQTSTPENNGLDGLTLSGILSRIDRIIADTEHLKGALNALEHLQVPPLPGGDGAMAQDLGNAEKAKAIADVAKCRETTNQQMLRLLEKMYDDVKRVEHPMSEAGFTQRMEAVSSIMEALRKGAITDGTPDRVVDAITAVITRLARE